MRRLISKLNNKNIHIVGFTGSEGSGILSLLIRLGIQDITVHDFVERKDIERSFRIWHKGLSLDEKSLYLQQFQNNLKEAKIRTRKDYLKDIEKADIIFVPQSWRLYPQRNKKLFTLKKNKAPFYTALKLYLEFCPAKTIGVTGTVGKGSVSSLIKEILTGSGKKAYFGGNETWNIQVLDKMPDMTSKDYLIIEISHRQLREGIGKAPQILVITNIYPNHLDEVSWKEYIDLKLGLLEIQSKTDTAVLNFDDQILSNLNTRFSSSVIYYSEKHPEKNTRNVQKIFKQIMTTKSEHYVINTLAVLTIADFLDINLEKALNIAANTQKLPSRMKKLTEHKGVSIYNDLKSTTPWATMKAIETLRKNIILVCGGDPKNINLNDFAEKLESDKVKKVIILEGKLADDLLLLIKGKKYEVAQTLEQALQISLDSARSGDKILLSPAAAFFYTKYIKGRKSIRKIISSFISNKQAS